MELSPQTQELIILVVSLLLGVIGMKPIDWLKKQSGIEDELATVFVYAIALLVGVLGLLASGQLFEIEFTLQNIITIAALFGAAAKLAYERMKARA